MSLPIAASARGKEYNERHHYDLDVFFRLTFKHNFCPFCRLIEPRYVESEIHDQPNTGNNRQVVALPLVLEQLKIRCQGASTG